MNNINYSILKDYLDGNLDYKARHELEKQAMHDPFLADALEGYSHTTRSVDRELSLLQKSLEARIDQQHENKNIFHFTWQRLSVAMAAAVIFTLAGILFWMKATQRPRVTHPNIELTIKMLNKKAVYPVGGSGAFNEYLTKKFDYVAGDKNAVIVLEFTVNPETLKPQNIKVIKSAEPEIDRQAIIALKNGPEWKAKSGEEIRIEIRLQHK